MIKTNVSFSLKTKDLQKLKKKFKELSDTSIDVGVFDNSQHYSGIGYATLMSMHHEGFITRSGTEIPSRPVLMMAGMDLYDFKNKNFITKLLEKGLSQWNTVTFKDKIADGIGNLVLDIAKNEKMGSPVWLEPVTEFTLENRIESKENTPLVDTGDLKDKLDYRLV